MTAHTSSADAQNRLTAREMRNLAAQAANEAGVPYSRFALSGRLLRITRPVLPPLVLSTIFRLLALLVHAALFGLGGWALAAYATGTDVSLGYIALWLVGLSLAKGVLRYLEQYAGHYVAFRSLALLRNYFYDKLEPQAPAQTEGMNSGDLMNRVTKDIDRIEVFFAHTIAPITTAVIAPLMILGYLGQTTSWAIAATLLPFLLVVGVIVPLLGYRATDDAATTLRATRGEIAHHMSDSVQGIREILLFAHQDAREKELLALESRVTSGLNTIMGFIAVRRGLNQGLLAAAMVAVFGVGASQVSAGSLSLAQLGLALGISLGAFAPVLAVEDFVADLDQAYASARRVFSITERTPLVASPASPRDEEVTGSAGLRMDSISFTYPDVNAVLTPADEREARPEVLHNVTINIAAGKTTAIVGSSGSGKSTVAALMDRMWDPNSGTVSIDGIDIRQISLEHLRNVVAYAPQRPHVFNDSVRANLLLAAPDASDSDLDDVLAMVGLDQWVAAEPQGINTVVGEMGERLSGGQRQRLAIARALLRKAPVTILDEATSQIDSETEKVVLEGIRQSTAGKTLVVIAHRISTVENADHIVVMDEGRVVEEGTYTELMARGGALAALANREQ